MPFFNKNELKSLLYKLGLVPNSSKGQVYIIDYQLCKRIESIVRDINSKNDNIIIEIGSGFGSFTDYLIEYTNYLILIEQDKISSNFLFNYYKESFPTDFIEERQIKYLGRIPLKKKIEIINGNILNISLRSLPSKAVIISNLPFKISYKFLIKLINSSVSISLLIVQYEFYEHLSAKYGESNYSAISVLCQTFFKVQLLEKLKKNYFYPKPEVDSVLIKILPTSDINREIFVENTINKYVEFIEFLFSNKNNILLTSINNYLKKKGLDETQIQDFYFHIKKTKMQNKIKKYPPNFLWEIFYQKIKNYNLKPNNIHQ